MRQLKSLISLLKASRSIETLIERNVSQYGLSLSEFMVLELLYSQKKDIAIQAIAQRVLLSSGSITYVIDQLESKNYVIRLKCENDKRKIYAHLTNEGLEKIQFVFNEHQQFIQEIFRVFSEDENKQYHNYNKKIGIHAQEKLKEGK